MFLLDYLVPLHQLMQGFEDSPGWCAPSGARMPGANEGSARGECSPQRVGAGTAG